MSLTRADKEWLFNLAKAVIKVVDGDYAAACLNTHQSEFLDEDSDQTRREDFGPNGDATTPGFFK